MPGTLRLTERVAPPLPLELALIDGLRAAAAEQIVSVAAMPGRDPRVRADFLRWLLLDALPSARLAVSRLRLADATIDGLLDLQGSHLTLGLSFRCCDFGQPINLTEATIPGFELAGGRVKAIFADRLTVNGSLLIRAATGAEEPRARIVVSGAIRLNGAKIHGNLDMEGARLGAEQAAARAYLPPVGIEPVCRRQNDDATVQQIFEQSDPVHPANRHHAWISLAADGMTVDGHALFVWPFLANGELRLDGCTIGRNLDCSGARLINPGGYTLSAAGARVAGTLYLGSPLHENQTSDNPCFESYGMVRIDGVRVDGDIDCSDGKFVATAFHPRWSVAAGLEHDPYALKANGVDVGANLRLAGRFVAHGNVSMINAKVSRDVNFTGAQFNFAGGEALCCDGISVAGAVFIDNGPHQHFRSDGVLRFVLADVQQGFYIRHATFDCAQPPSELLQCNRFENFRAPEQLRGTRDPDHDPDRGQVIYACGIYAEDAKISGTFTWKGVGREPGPGTRGHYRAWLHISGAQAEKVEDELESWHKLDRFDVTDCRYRSIDGLFHEHYRTPKELDAYIKDRLCLLDREYAPLSLPPSSLPDDRDAAITHDQAIDRFKPQPYLQLARVLRTAGLDSAADETIVRLERHRNRYSGFSDLTRLGRWLFFDLLLRYGFDRSRPAIALLGLAAISAVMFQIAYCGHHIVATWHNKQDITVPADAAQPHVAFNAFVFALDTLVPLVDLNQKDNWEAEPLSVREPGIMSDAERTAGVQGSDTIPWFDLPLYIAEVWYYPSRTIAVLIIFNKCVGWVLTTAFVGGVTGVLRGGKEPPEMPGAE